MNTTENSKVIVDPLLDLQAIKDEYRLNLSTIKTIVDNETMPVVWLGSKRYLRQSDLEEYITKHTKLSTDKPVTEDELQELTKPPKQKTKQSTPTVKKASQASKIDDKLSKSKPSNKVNIDALRKKYKNSKSAA